MSTYPPESQMNFIIQWFKGWSEFQKEDFGHVLSQRMKQAANANAEDNDNAKKDGDLVNNLVNGIKGLETSRPPSLFLCQVKLFNEWWTNWTSEDRDKMVALFKEADSTFYTAVESGESRKLNEDFMMVVPTKKGGDEEDGLSSSGVDDTTATTNGDTTTIIKPPVFNVTKVIINNGPSSFSSIENENGLGGGDEGKEITNEDVTVSNDNCDSAEPIATEI